MAPDRLRYWPQILQRIAREIGEDAALRLAGELGGQKINVPRVASGSALARDHGLALAEILVETYGGGTAYIPNLGLQLAAERRHFILTNPQLSANAIAAKLRISSRWVEKVRESARGDERQASLFAD